MLTIVHTYSRFRSSEVKCYVNGELVSGGDLTMAQMNEVREYEITCPIHHTVNGYSNENTSTVGESLYRFLLISNVSQTNFT